MCPFSEKKNEQKGKNIKINERARENKSEQRGQNLEN
jgi:hypothetical protein